MENIAYKFVKWDVPALETLSHTEPYKLKCKLISGEKLSREEKNRIAVISCRNGYTRTGGWHFSFYRFLTQFVVKQYGSWCEYYAVDKTALRHALDGRIEQIVTGKLPEIVNEKKKSHGKP